MGKGRSPAKWFKSLLGKKSSSKSNCSKKNDIFVSVSDPTVDSLTISAPISGDNANNGILYGKNVSTLGRNVLSTGGEDARTQAVGDFGSQEDLENLKLTEAVITVQAACRGYQARRRIHMLKGVIQLQALIRGHLVRRQAVSALYCVKRIVKLQALARGYIVRHSDIGLDVQKIRKGTPYSNSVQVVTSMQAEKQSESVFVHKLLASSGTAIPLSLNCDPREPDMAWTWLDRWTWSHFWAPLPEQKKKLDCVSDEKNGSSQTVKRRQLKRTTQKSPTVKAEDGSTSGSNKYKQRLKKDSSSPLLSAQEKEIEKNNSKKNHAQFVSEKSEIIPEKRKHSTRKTSDHTATDVSEQGHSTSSEKKKDLAVSKSKDADPEKVLGLPEDKKDKGLNSLKISRAQTVADRSEGANEKRKHSTRKISDRSVTDTSELAPSASSEKKKDLTVPKSKESHPEKNLDLKEEKHDNEPSSPKKNSLQNIADGSEVVNEERKDSSRNVSDHTITDVSDQDPNVSSAEKKDLAVSKSKDSEKSLAEQQVDKHDDEPKSPNPKKTHLHTVAGRSEVVNEKSVHSSRKISDHTVPDVSEQDTSASSEKKLDSAVVKSKESVPMKSIELQAEEKHDNGSHTDTNTSVLQNSMTNDKNEGTQGVGEDLNGSSSCIGNNYQRRASLPAAIFSDQDSESHSTPRLPSYMAPTESAKAKLRGQGSPRLATDLLDKNSLTRRHSLSSSFNGKSGSFSPRAERLVALSGRGAIRSDRSLSSSRDGTDKLVQPQWRR